MEDLSISDKIVDLDDQSTWPEDVITFIREKSDSVNLEENSSMSIGDDVLLPLLNGSSLLVYHATRLLPHEKEDIRVNGLHILTEEFAARKIRKAVENGYLAEEIGKELQQEIALWDDSDGKRTNQICFVFGRSPFKLEEPGYSHFFEEWGGEFISYTDAGKTHKKYLKQIGKPAIVKALLPISLEPSLHAYPELTVSFIEAFREEISSSELYLENKAISAKNILDILSCEILAIGE